MAEAPSRRLTKRIATGIAIALGAVVALLVALVLLVDSGAVTKRVVDLVVPRASAALGRDVAVRGAHLKIFPQTRVRLEGFSVAGRPGEPPLVGADALDVEVALWPLLRSLGKDVQVQALALDRPAVNLVRAKDGTWNYEGLGGKPTGPQPAAPSGEKARVVVRRFSIRDGSIRLLDATRPGGEAGVALQAIDLDMTGVGPGLPVDLNLSAALGSDRPNLSLQISAATLPAAMPQRPEDWPAVQGVLRLGPLALDRVAPLLPAGIHSLVQGGTASLDARVSTQEGAYHVDGSGALRDLRLRGQPASGSFRAAATVPPAQPGRARLEIQNLQVKGPGVDLGGNAVAEANPIRIRFAIDGPLLDLDALMGALPPSAPEPKASPGSPIPPAVRETIDAASAVGSLDIGELRSGKLRATQVRTRVTLQRGVLTVQQATGAVYGGTLDLSGTQAALTQAEPSWKLRGKVQGLDVGEATRTFVGSSPVVGKSDLSLDLAGKGIEWQRTRNAITGAVALGLRDGALTTTDLAGQTFSALSTGLKALGQGGAAAGMGRFASGKTDIKDLEAHFTVKDGWMTLSQPLRTKTSIGPLELGGRIGLDMRLDLNGKIDVPKSALAGIVPAVVQLPPSIPVPLTIGGTLSAPSVAVKADQAIAGLAKGQASAASKALREEAEKAAKKGIGGFLKQFGGKQ